MGKAEPQHHSSRIDRFNKGLILVVAGLRGRPVLRGANNVVIYNNKHHPKL